MSSVDEANNPDLNGHGDHSGDIIPPFTYTYTEKGKGQDPDVVVTVTFGGLNWDADGQAIYANGCVVPPTVFTGEATVSDSVTICTVDDVTQTVDYTSGLVTRTSEVSQEAADAAAQAAAETAAAADLEAQLAQYPDYTSGACQAPTTPPTTPPTPTTVAPVLPATVVETVEEPVAPTEPEQVAVPLPATVDEPEEPEVVSVPLPATVKVPAAVPAGDGSSQQGAPMGAMALLVASLIGIGAAGTRLLVRRQ